MTSTVNTRDASVGDRIDLADRGVIVASNDDRGLGVVWYDHMMRGPYFAVLPHCTLYRRTYHDERNGEHQSYWDMHPDFTGRTGEV